MFIVRFFYFEMEIILGVCGSLPYVLCVWSYFYVVKVIMTPPSQSQGGFKVYNFYDIGVLMYLNLKCFPFYDF